MKKVMISILLVVFVGIFLVSGYLLVDYLVDSVKQKAGYQNLVDMVGPSRPTLPPLKPDTDPTDPEATGEVTGPTEPEETLASVVDPDTGKEVDILAEYAQLYLLNRDLVGWIEIEGTNIQYPVVQSPYYRDYYLHVNFYDEYNAHGCIYAQEECDIEKPSDNVILYGHYMRDDSMFAQLHNYASEEFWQEHQTVRFDSLTKRRAYQIIAVFKTPASGGLAYHKFIDAKDEADFNEFVAEIKSRAFYDTGVTAEYGDKLLCLSTCEYSLGNGRLVVVAKLVQEAGPVKGD